MAILDRIFGRPTALERADAFADCYERTHRDVYRYLMALCGGDGPEAEDVTAETYLRAWKARHQFRGDEATALGWLLTIARRVLIDRHRYDTRHPIADLEPTLPDEALDAESLFLEQEDLQGVLDALQQLPARQRDIVILRYMLEWSVTDIAAHLGISANTASVSLRRALQRLKSQLDPMIGERTV